MTKAIAEGHHSITPSIMYKDTQKAIDFYKKAFNAKTLGVFQNLNGRGIMHAEIQIGDSIIMMGDEMPAGKASPSAETMGGSPVTLFLYVPDVDASFKQAIEAGAKETMPVADMFWGDRAGSLMDPFGYSWMMATHKRDMSPDQIRKEAESFFAQSAKKN